MLTNDITCLSSNTFSLFIKLTKQLVNQQRIGTYMLYASSEIKLATLALNSVLEARTNVTKKKHRILIEDLISYKLRYLNNGKKQG